MPDEKRVVLVKPGDVLLVGNVGELAQEAIEVARVLTGMGVRTFLIAGDIDMAAVPSDGEGG